MLEQAFSDLCRELGMLRREFLALKSAAREEAALENGAAAVLASLEGLLVAAERGRVAARLPVDVDAARRTLPRCQRELSVLKHEFLSGIGSPLRVEEWRAAGREEIAFRLGRCSAPLFAAEWALTACWRSLAEYSALNPGGVVPRIPRL